MKWILMPHEIGRRTFCAILGGALVTSGGCEHAPEAPTEAAAVTLRRMLGLKPDEAGWLGVLGEKEQHALRDALVQGGSPSAQTVELLMKVLGRRERLFPYVGYPPLPNRLTACDGLLRE
jgi:hypothetical protein